MNRIARVIHDTVNPVPRSVAVRDVKGPLTAAAVAFRFIADSQWVAVMPLPDDYYEIAVRAEHVNRLDETCDAVGEWAAGHDQEEDEEPLFQLTPVGRRVAVSPPPRRRRHTRIPKDWPVQPLPPAHDVLPNHVGTCGHCGLAWDDDTPTSMTPAPAARCPFEAFHLYAVSEEEA